MSVEQLIADWQEETDFYIKDILADRSDPDAEYVIEHHFAAKDFDVLEKAAVDAFKAGFEVSDGEEAQLENGTEVWSCDITKEMPLDAAAIKEDIATLGKLADKHKIMYDGWDTYFIPIEGEEYSEEFLAELGLEIDDEEDQ